MFELDIERLHRDTELFDRGELVDRGVGKTTVIIYKLLGCIETAPPFSTIIVVAHNSKYREHLVRRIYEELVRNDINVQYKRKTEFITPNGVHVMFVVPEDVLYHRLDGIKIFAYFVDDPEVFWEQTHEPGYIINYLNSRLVR